MQIESDMSRKAKMCKNLRKKSEKQWINRVLSDSLNGSCMKMEPYRLAHKKPTTKVERNKVKRAMGIVTLVHLAREAEEMIRKPCKEGIIKEAPGESPYCTYDFFIQKPNRKGLRLITYYCAVIKLINLPQWPLQFFENIK